MSRRTIRRGVKPRKERFETKARNPAMLRRESRRQADDMAVIELLKAGQLDLARGYHAREIAAELGWTQGRLRAAVERVRVNARARRNQREKGKS